MSTYCLYCFTNQLVKTTATNITNTNKIYKANCDFKITK